MANFLETIKPNVRALAPYTLKPVKARIKLNQNESAWDLPPEIKQETLRRFAELRWSRYPDFVPTQLHQRLADYSGWIADGIVAGNGSNELIQALLMVTVGEGRQVLINEPTFALYRQIATVLGAEVISLPLTPQLVFDIPALQSAIELCSPEVTIICSPNNPTGCVISQADLISLLKASKGLVVVDEAYFEFSDQTVVPLLERHSNLVVLRTFSKAMALAGLRVGYLLAAPELVREVSKAVLPYNLNVLSQIASEVSIEMYKSAIRPLIELIKVERERLFVGLGRIAGLTPVASRGNFMVVRSPIPPSQVCKELLQREILIRDVSGYPLLQDYFRVSVGKPQENDQVIKALLEIL